MTSFTTLKGEWVSIEDAIPNRLMKVEWKCENGIEDIGIFTDGEFRTIDCKSVSQITHWRKFSGLVRIEEPIIK